MFVFAHSPTMKKFLHETKATLGMAKATNDTEYDRLHNATRVLDEAIDTYYSAARAMDAASKEMAEALAKMSKAFGGLADGENGTTQQQKVNEICAGVAESAGTHYYKALKLSLKSGLLKPLEDDVSVAKKLGEKRKTRLSEYDTYRLCVEKKEAEYAKKNKSLDESKEYKQDVEKRDKKKFAYDEVNTEYKKHCMSMLKKKESLATEAMTHYLNSAVLFLSNVEKDLNKALAELK